MAHAVTDAALRVGQSARSAVALDRPETSTIAMSSIIFASVPMPDHTLKPLQRKEKRPTPFETMESSTRQTEVVMAAGDPIGYDTMFFRADGDDPEAFEHALCFYREMDKADAR